MPPRQANVACSTVEGRLDSRGGNQNRPLAKILCHLDKQKAMEGRFRVEAAEDFARWHGSVPHGGTAAAFLALFAAVMQP